MPRLLLYLGGIILDFVGAAAAAWPSDLAARVLRLLEPRGCCGFPSVVASGASVMTTWGLLEATLRVTYQTQQSIIIVIILM